MDLLSEHGIGTGINPADKQTLITIANEAEADDNQLRSDLATVIGSPAQSNDSMLTLVQDIQTQKTNLSSNVNKFGESTSGADSLKSLVDNVGLITSKIGTNTVIAPGTSDKPVPAGYYDGTVSSGKVSAITGTAQASDVASGKTFSSANGVNQIGTSNAVTVNGVVESYIASSTGNINAGDFVKFVDNIGTNGIINTDNNSGVSFSAVALSDSSVLVIHSFTSSNLLYGVVCTISGTTITLGNETLIDATGNSGFGISAVALSPTSVFVTFCQQSTTSTICHVILTISGTTIAVGSVYTTLSGNTGISSTCSVALSSTSVFVCCSSIDSYFKLVGIAFTISGTSMTSSVTVINSTNYSCNGAISAVALSPTSVFIAHGYGVSGTALYGVVCTISGTTIAYGTDTAIEGANTGYFLTVESLNNLTVFIAYTTTSQGSSIYGVICSIYNTTSITVNTVTLTQIVSSVGPSLRSVLLSPTSVLIVFEDNATELSGIICAVPSLHSAIIPATAFKINSQNQTASIISVTRLRNGNAFIANQYYGSSVKRLMAGVYIRNVQTISSLSDLICGVAMSNANANSQLNITKSNT